MLPKYLQKQSIKKESLKAEKRVVKELGGRARPGSGAKWFAKGDFEWGNCLVELKTTEKSQIIIKRDMIEKIYKEAIVESKQPVIQIEMPGYSIWGEICKK